MSYQGIMHIMFSRRRQKVLTFGRDAINTFVLTIIGALA